MGIFILVVKSEYREMKIKKPWPTQKAMQQVYANKLWGDNGTPFYSGEGSHHPEITEIYVNEVVSFLTSFTPKISVCDLGCGDFNVGKQLYDYTLKYTAVDIVPELIEYNKLHFQADNLQFVSLDIAKDVFPKADCVIIRQVLQHLSNTEISKVVSKLSCFSYLILTEHLPNGIFIPNVDIISGQGIRLKKKSGVDLLASPFNLKYKKAEELFCYDLGEKKGSIVTTLYRL